MICMKKDYERNVKHIKDQLLVCQHEHLSTLHMPLLTTSQYLQGPLSSLCKHSALLKCGYE